MTNQSTVLENVEIVHLDITIWTGTKKLEAADFDRVSVSDLPSADVASLGVKKLISKDHLKPLAHLRYRAEEVCKQVGVRFLGGYAVPQDAIAALSADLSSICSEFGREVDEFVANYDDRVEEWIRANPEFEQQIRQSKIPAHAVKRRFHADYSIFCVSASRRDQTNSMASRGDDLHSSFLSGVVADLSDYVDRVRHVPRGEFRSTIRGSIGSVAQKLRRFSFLDPTGAFIELAKDLELAVLGSGPIKDADYRHLSEVIRNLDCLDGIRRELEARAGRTAVAQPVHQLPLLTAAPEAAPVASPANDAPDFDLVPDFEDEPQDGSSLEDCDEDPDFGDPEPRHPSPAGAEEIDFGSAPSQRSQGPSLTSLNW